MKMTKRVVIRIIVAVAVAFILSKFKLLGIMQVSAKSMSTTFSYSNQLITNSSIDFNFTNPFATNMKRGTLITNVTISTNILYTNSKKPILRQATVFNGTTTNVCKIGSVSSGGVFTQNSGGTFNNFDYDSQTYTLECEVTPNPKIEKITLYFSGNTNYSYLSFGPTVSFRENDILLAMEEQNMDCESSKNIFDGQVQLGNYDSNGNPVSNNNIYRNVSRISITPNTTYTFSINGTKQRYVLYFYDNNGTFISMDSTNDGTFITPSNAYFLNFRCFGSDFTSNFSSLKIQLELGSSATSYIPYGEESCISKTDKQIQKQEETTQAIQETNDYLKSDDHSEADSEASGFFNNFGGNNHGISGIVTAPLRLLQSLSTASCSPLTFPLPFIGNQISLPCMRGIYEQYFGVFFSLWQLITTGLISYNVSLNIYSKVRAMQNPNNDKIEVLNL